MPIICGKNDCQEFSGFDVVLFIQGGYWILEYSFDRFVYINQTVDLSTALLIESNASRFYQYHHMQSRRNGYLEFYRKTRFVRSLPFLIISASN